MLRSTLKICRKKCDFSFFFVVVVPLKSPCAVEAAFKEGEKVNLRFLSRGESRLQVISVTAPGARAEQILHYMQAAVAKHGGLVASGVGGKKLQFKTFFTARFATRTWCCF